MANEQSNPAQTGAALDEKASIHMVIANESPHTSGGVHTVVDDVHKGRAVVRESAQEEIKHG